MLRSKPKIQNVHVVQKSSTKIRHGITRWTEYKPKST